jgi:uncharacterized zinc-type alcohol dehydrogenase-like protein
MAVMFADALGAHVVVFTTSPNKKEDALRLGADEVVISRNTDQMRKHRGTFDFILDAVSAEHDINAYIQLLRHHHRRRTGQASFMDECYCMKR